MAKKNDELVDILMGIEKSVNSKRPRLSLGCETPDAEIMSFGISAVDNASNVGGHPRGVIIEIYGPESSGKSYTCYKTIAAYQAAGHRALLLDVENAYWEEWIAQAGVDTSKLVVGRDFESGEQALMYAEKAALTKQFGVIVVDSVAALLPQSEAEADLDQAARVGAHAAMMSRSLRKLQGIMYDTDTTLIFVNQIRSKIGNSYGNPEDTPGGKALKFYSGMRISLTYIGREKARIDGEEVVVGIKTRVKFLKNKIGQPFGEDEFSIYSVKGMDTPMYQLISLATRLRVFPGRKSFDEKNPDKKTYYWKSDDGSVEDTQCTIASELADWVEAHDMTDIVYEKVIERATARNIEIPPEVLTMKGDVQGTVSDAEDVVEAEVDF